MAMNIDGRGVGVGAGVGVGTAVGWGAAVGVGVGTVVGAGKAVGVGAGVGATAVGWGVAVVAGVGDGNAVGWGMAASGGNGVAAGAGVVGWGAPAGDAAIAVGAGMGVGDAVSRPAGVSGRLNTHTARKTAASRAAPTATIICCRKVSVKLSAAVGDNAPGAGSGLRRNGRQRQSKGGVVVGGGRGRRCHRQRTAVAGRQSAADVQAQAG